MVWTHPAAVICPFQTLVDVFFLLCHAKLTRFVTTSYTVMCVCVCVLCVCFLKLLLLEKVLALLELFLFLEHMCNLFYKKIFQSFLQL